MQASEEAVKRYLSHVNNHNVDAALDCLADSFQLRFGDSSFAMPKESMSAALGWDAGTDGHIEWRVVVADERRVTIEGRETNEFLRLIGIDGLDFLSTYEIDGDGLIVKQRHEVEQGAAGIELAIRPLVEWASKEEPDELAEIYPDDEMIYNREFAERWLAMARRWPGRASRPSEKQSGDG